MKEEEKQKLNIGVQVSVQEENSLSLFFFFCQTSRDFSATFRRLSEIQAEEGVV